jgi:hypothetical protein
MPGYEGVARPSSQEARSQGQETNFRLLVHLDIESGETETGDVGSLQVIYSNPEFPRVDERNPAVWARIRRSGAGDGSQRSKYPDPTSAIVGWFKWCSEHHDDSSVLQQVAQKKNKPSHIYLVDCYDACVVKKGFNSSKPTYAALSYVWGTVSQFQLLKENHDSLLKPGSLRHRRWPLNRSI